MSRQSDQDKLGGVGSNLDSKKAERVEMGEETSRKKGGKNKRNFVGCGVSSCVL